MPDTCRLDCTNPRCGDGTQDTDEACDLGIDNADTPDAFCRITCALARCGDGIVDVSAESCDDGNTESGDGCSSECINETLCPNGSIDFLEECDDGNDVYGDGCTPMCTLEFSCGNVLIDAGEECDNGGKCVGGSSNGNVCSTTLSMQDCGSDGQCIPQSGDGCSASCTLEFCGDGYHDNDGADNIVDTFDDEECDDGNTESGDGCSYQCKTESCGDGYFDSDGIDNVMFTADDEECEDGNTVDGDGCDAQCREESNLASLCGNGYADPAGDDGDIDLTYDNEECDDGAPPPSCPPDCPAVYNSNRPYSCRPNCKEARCGDGIVDRDDQPSTHTWVEDCDDANTIDDDECNNKCLWGPMGNICGDGTLDPDGPDNEIDTADDEECDDGNLAAHDGCSALCKIETGASLCGNGVLDAGEQCDDGAGNASLTPNACSSICLLPFCGNFVVDDAPPYNEECDAGFLGMNMADVCRTNCKNPRCGDAIVDSGEQCDAGTNNSNTTADTCREDCTSFRCGDGVKDSTEECDDGNTDDKDQCSNSCISSCGNGICQTWENCANCPSDCGYSYCCIDGTCNLHGPSGIEACGGPFHCEECCTTGE